MAINIPPPVPSDTMAHFNRVAEQIERTFNQLIEQLIQRKDALLQKVVQLREEFLNKEKTRIEALEELLRAQRHMAELSLKANVNLPLHQQAGQLYQQGQKEQETPTKLPAITFQYPSLATFQSQISEFGDVVTWKCPDYSTKKPVVLAVKLGTGNDELKYPRGLALDEISQKVYIADIGNICVKVLSFQGEFLTQFGQDVLSRPHGIAVTEQFIFVTDWTHHSLFQFNKDTLQLINRAGTKGKAEGELDYPYGLCVDKNGDVFIADSVNRRVSVFSGGKLSFKSCIGTGILYKPHDVKLSPDTLVVLDRSPKCVTIFSRSGDLLTSCVSQGDKHDCLVDISFFFCLDPDMNILISDYEQDTIKIFTHSGELVHTLGKKLKSRGEIHRPCGIAVTHSGTIFIVSHNPNFTFQCY